jgi:hypothetical protein
MMPMQDIAAVPLINDVVRLRHAAEPDLGQLLKAGCGLRVVDLVFSV